MVLLVDQVRTLTTNFQRLLAQATKEIKKLTAEKVNTIIKDITIITESSQEANIILIEIILLLSQSPSLPPQVGLEREQEKLLTVNVELALETKRLLEQQKEWEEQEKVKMMVMTDMEFVQNFTPPDCQAKNFTPPISPNFNSLSDKNTKIVKMEKFAPLDKKFTLAPAVTAGTNLTSEGRNKQFSMKQMFFG